jgi:hypothetical protein
MPWTSREAKKHDRKANTPKKRRMWSHVANSVLKRTGSDAAAVRAANGVVKKSKRKVKTRKTSR